MVSRADVSVAHLVVLLRKVSRRAVNDTPPAAAASQPAAPDEIDFLSSQPYLLIVAEFVCVSVSEAAGHFDD